MPNSQTKTKVFSLVMRRMRAPLIVLITAYSIAILGMVLVPGQDPDGNVWHMDFFHAFYFASYMATTIGFGEIPYEFSNAQRLWATLCIYLGVTAWLYAIGKIMGLIQDPAFKRVLTQNRFIHNVATIKAPFYLICGYGETGTLVIRALNQRNLRSVAIDIRPNCIDELSLDNLALYVPGLCADASEPEILRAAGLESPYCAGIMALTDDDQVNLKIALSAKLLSPSLRVICRAESKAIQNNMASFDTDHIINPFDAFADQLAIALHSPDLHQLFEWLTHMPKTALAERQHPPHGHWIICGYGRFGKAVHKYLQFEGIPCTIVETSPEEAGCKGQCIEGRGTEAVTLRAARIDQAQGIVAGTDDDADNLSILLTAKDLKPSIYTVARQNNHSNEVIFNAANIDLVMEHAHILTLKILGLVTAPLLSDFLRLARHHKNQWAKEVVALLRPIAKGSVPDIWTISINEQQAPALIAAFKAGSDTRLGHLVTDPRNRNHRLNTLPLLIKRQDTFIPLPQLREQLHKNDQILFCGRYGVFEQMSWTLNNLNALRYIETGYNRPDGYVWRYFSGAAESKSWPKAIDERNQPRS